MVDVVDPRYDVMKLYEHSKKIEGWIWFDLQLNNIKVHSKGGLSLYAFINRHWVGYL